ncbi:hypothetical protein Lmac_3192 [Legionella maceachernii]|uniref:Uncharacterized protein n=1 Tax=Legionella maceachernii TaxID=466 RepID=A0A0W0VTQ8_9GAMM|nr:hypothetical protein Lmac_3192 [Legionella maceachernii]SJZ69924.1 hypothetical protein SAMN02745128_00825 [Legionella maceachernii]SUP02240.1 Uncharacterised protein [Legionella maceachernii]
MGTQKALLIKTENVLKMGMRKFRSHLPQYLLTFNPVAITVTGKQERPIFQQSIMQKNRILRLRE